MSSFADHPFILVAAAAICFPVLFPLARFFFDDFESFKAEVGPSRDWERELWLLGFIPGSPYLYLKIIGFVGIFAILVAAMHHLILSIVGVAQ